MTELLIYQKSLARIEQELTARYPKVVPLSWQADNVVTRHGQPVPLNQLSPQVGWISQDVLANRLLDEYGAALTQFKSTQWVQTINAGLDAPVYATLASHGIRLSKSSAQAPPIAEYVLAYALYHTQGLDRRLEQQQGRQWKNAQFNEISGSRWLLVGFGHIGRSIAKRLRAFEATVVAVRHSDTDDPLADTTVQLSSLHDELPHADVVVLACPHTEQTDQLADRDFFRAMKPGSLLVNVARGGLVVENDLLDGLANNQPARAVLDVFNTEPLPAENPLWDHPQVIVTSHTSNAGAGTRARGDAQFFDNLGRFLKDNSPLDEVIP